MTTCTSHVRSMCTRNGMIWCDATGSGGEGGKEGGKEKRGTGEARSRGEGQSGGPEGEGHCE